MWPKVESYKNEVSCIQVPSFIVHTHISHFISAFPVMHLNEAGKLRLFFPAIFITLAC